MTAVVPHDASAVAGALDATSFTLRRGPVRVATGGVAVGQTIQMRQGERFVADDRDDTPAQSICIGVDAPRLRA